jgi:hypothetical protein
MKRRVITFVCGVLTGGAVLYFLLGYHILHAQDGLHLVPKQKAQLTETYVDIRAYGIAEWAQHPDLAADVLQAGKQELIEGASQNALRNSLDRLLAPPEAR